MMDQSPLSLILKIDKKTKPSWLGFLFIDTPIERYVCRKSLDTFLLGS